MELASLADAERARVLLDGVVSRMMGAVHRYEGTVNQLMGDGLMALFGAPLAHEDHALRACYAALDMQRAIEDYAAELRRTQGVSVQIRVGLNSGEVVVRSIQSDLHMDYSAVGPTTHLAARMEQLAAPGTIVFTAETRRLVEGRVEDKSLGPVAVKGVTGSVEVFQLLGAVEVRSRLHSPPGRSVSPFVGRDAELAELARSLERAAEKRGQVMALVGEPGVGKSRLILELARSLAARDWLLLERARYERQTPYRPVAALVRAYFRIQLRDDHRATQDKIVGRLSALGLSLDATVSPLLAVLDVPVEDPGWQALSAAQCRRRILDAVVRVLVRASEVEPLLIVVEDLHWLDAESQAVLDALVDSLLGARVLLLVTYRPEYQHAWASRASYHHSASSHTRGATEELLACCWGRTPGAAPEGAARGERRGQSLLPRRERARGDRVRRARGRARRLPPGAAAGRVRIPASVEAVLAARIDRLPPPEKRLLQSAAVIGRDVPLSLCRPSSTSRSTSCAAACRSSRRRSSSTRRACFPRRNTRSSTG
jgi:class 3 adenylate cyclase